MHMMRSSLPSTPAIHHGCRRSGFVRKLTRKSASAGRGLLRVEVETDVSSLTASIGPGTLTLPTPHSGLTILEGLDCRVLSCLINPMHALHRLSRHLPVGRISFANARQSLHTVVGATAGRWLCRYRCRLTVGIHMRGSASPVRHWIGVSSRAGGCAIR